MAWAMARIRAKTVFIHRTDLQLPQSTDRDRSRASTAMSVWAVAGLQNLLSKLRQPTRLAGLSVMGARCLLTPAGARKCEGKNLKVLVLGDGCAGAENQSLGLVHHITRLSRSHGWSNVECSLRHILPTRAFRILPAAAHIALAHLVPGIGMRDLDEGEHQ